MNDLNDLLADLEFRAKTLYGDRFARITLSAARLATDEVGAPPRIWLSIWAKGREELSANGKTFEAAFRLLEARLTTDEELEAERENYEIRKQQDEEDRIAQFMAIREVV